MLGAEQGGKYRVKQRLPVMVRSRRVERRGTRSASEAVDRVGHSAMSTTKDAPSRGGDHTA